jgi:hypothetical protein
VKCNCDTISPIQLVDSGELRLQSNTFLIKLKTIMRALPQVSSLTCSTRYPRLNFGRTQLETSSGVHTLSRFECTGTGSFTGLLPKSCQDLRLIGHTPNEFYSIKGAKMMESVFCDLTALLLHMAPGVYLYDSQNYNIFFTGFMLEEEIVASL